MKKVDVSDKKWGRNEDVMTETLGKICKAFDYSTDDMIEFLPDEAGMTRIGYDVTGDTEIGKDRF